MKKLLAIIKFREGISQPTSHYVTESQYKEMSPHLTDHFSSFELRKITSGDKAGNYRLIIIK